jgi:hypothetical protein
MSGRNYLFAHSISPSFTWLRQIPYFNYTDLAP